MLQQKYNWIEKCWQVPPIRRISECWGLCCYVGQPDPWSPYSNADPDPTACAPRSRCCDPRSHPIFCCWSLIPYSLFFTTLSCHHFSSNVAVSRPCCLSEFTLTNWAPALTGPHFNVYECKETKKTDRIIVTSNYFIVSIKLDLDVGNVEYIVSFFVILVAVSWTVLWFVFGRFLSKTKRFWNEFYLSLKTGVKDHGIALAEGCRKNWIWLVCTEAL